MLKGIPASSGIAIGKAFVISENKIMVKETIIQDTAKEKALFHNSINIAKVQLETIKAAEVLNMPSSEEVLKSIESVVNN